MEGGEQINGGREGMAENEVEVLTPEQVQEAEKRVEQVCVVARSVEVKSREDLESANRMFLAIADREKKVGEFLDPHIQRAFQAHRALTEEKRKLMAPLAAAKEFLRKAMNRYVMEEEEKRKKEEMAAREIAQREEEDRKLRLAEMAEKKGMDRLAEQIIQQPVDVPLSAVALPTVKSELEKMTVTDVWKFEVYDFPQFVAAVADPASAIPLTVLDYKPAVIKTFVNTLKDTMKWPGVKVWKERSVRRTGR
jgi:hypothetical protein